MAGGSSGAVRGNAGGHDGGAGTAFFPDGSAIPGGVRSAGGSGTAGWQGKSLIPDLWVLLVPVLHVPFFLKIGSDGVAYQSFGDTIG